MHTQPVQDTRNKTIIKVYFVIVICLYTNIYEGQVVEGIFNDFCLSWVQIWLHACKKVASDLRIGGGLPKFPPLLTTRWSQFSLNQAEVMKIDIGNPKFNL